MERRTVTRIVGLSSGLALICGVAIAQVAPPDDGISSLIGVSPMQPNTQGIIVDKLAAQQLGKAFFWDIQVGSDGQACASCHFHAGADIRIKNQVSPGHDGVFGKRANGQPTGPNETLSAADFPFRQLKDILDRNSPATFDLNDRFSSQGTFAGDFVSAPRRAKLAGEPSKKTATENCNLKYDPDNNPFHANGLIYRKVEPRQTPTVINAVFNHRQFWDGRANNVFNGVDPFGLRTNKARPGAGVLFNDGESVTLKKLAIRNASLASQGVGPPLSDFEMSCKDRTFADLGRKMILRQPLAFQKVHKNDSLFSKTRGLVHVAKGLRGIYRELIQKAFHPSYWDGGERFKIDPDTGQVMTDRTGWTIMEHNFSLFWGLALHEYQALLISDKTPLDEGTMSAAAKRGRTVFTGQGKCVNCHKGPLLSGATVPPMQNNQLVENMLMGDNGVALYDNAFYNIGVRPTFEDIGLGAKDPFGNPLSFTRQLKAYLTKGKDPVDPLNVEKNIANFEVSLEHNLGLRTAVDGAFKTPILRNVGLNPPYMHNGGQATLAQVVDFYNRGGDRQGPNGNDTTGFGPNGSNLDPDITKLGLDKQQREDLVQFMLELTDKRVACHSEQFDHPEIKLTNGHKNAPNSNGTAEDIFVTLPAVGKGGLKAEGLPCFPNTGKLFGKIQETFAVIAK